MNNISSKFSPWQYRNIALAAMTQCARLVHSLAHTGKAEKRALDTCIAPLLVLNPGSVDEVYPDVEGFAMGLDALQRSFSSEGLKEFDEPFGYFLGIMVLQQQLMKSDSMQARIRHGLQDLQATILTAAQQELAADAPAPRENLGLEQTDSYDFAALAALYQDTVSQLAFRIRVKGNPEHLQDKQVADKIRALLLAGIRSSVLWQQLGGRRWHLFFYKKRIRDCVIGVRRQLLTVH